MSLVPQVPPLFEHQGRSIEFEGANSRICDFSDPGTGKTRVRLEAYSKRRVAGARCMLVLAPKSLLYSAWAADCRRYTPWLKVSCAYADNREKAFAAGADIYVTNHDAVKWLAKQPDSFFARFSDLIIDESEAFKHHTSQRSKAVAKIKRHFETRVVMSGSPDTNSVTDLWHQVNIVDDGARLGKSFFAFRMAVCVPEQVGPQANMLKWRDRPGAEAVVADKIKDITIRHKLRECLDLPPNFQYSVPFEMKGGHEKRYREMEALAVTQVRGKVVSAVNAATVVNKLLQIASGAVYDSESVYHVINRDRYELVMDLAGERRHVIVFFNWLHQRDLLIEEAKKRGVTYALVDGSVAPRRRTEIVSAYQAGMYRVLFAHPQSAAHGLTLTRGTRTIWASPTYNLSHWIQGNHRIDRAGQVEKTDTVSVLSEGTIEGHVHTVMSEKGGRMEELLEYLK
jgi:SNF2 family DNA or RNA helicase